MKYRMLVLILITMMGSVSAMAQVVSSGKRVDKRIKPFRIYKRHQLEGISADGRYTLFYKTSRTKHGKYGMKVIETESGREIAMKKGWWLPSQLIPNTTSVLYQDGQKKYHEDLEVYEIWDFKAGVAKMCIKDIRETGLKDIRGLDSTSKLNYIVFFNERGALGIIPYNFYRNGKKVRSKLLVKVELPGCKLKVIGDIYADLDGNSSHEGTSSSIEFIEFTADKKHVLYAVGNRIIVRNTSTFAVERVFTVNLDKKLSYEKASSSIEFTADKKHMLYVLGDKKIIIRNTSKFEIEKMFKLEAPLKLSYLRDPTFTEDGKHMILQVETHHVPNVKKRYFLLIYDAKTFKGIRRIEVTGKGKAIVSPLAVTPNGRFVAVAYKTVEEGFLYLFSHFNQIVEQAHIDLFDLRTGEKVATMSHRKRAEKRDVPWMWDIGGLQFTPDGKYLFTSDNRDTYVWDVSALTSNESLTSSTRK